MSSTAGMILAIVIYMVIVLYIGFRCSKQNKNTDDFYLGGRKLGPYVTAMSAEASDMSSWLLMGLPGVAYATGFADATWTAIGLAIGTYVNWLIVAKRLRNYTYVCKNSNTIPAFFSNRYDDKKRILSIISALVILVFFVPYTASGFAACGKLFAMIFDMDYFTAMLISAFVIVFYTTLVGFLAASTTDFMQSIVMTIAIVVVMVYGITQVGGMSEVIENAKGIAGYFSMTSIHKAGGSVEYNGLTIFSTLAWGLGYFGMPHILLRFMAIDDVNKLKVSRRVASIWVVISMTVAVLIGIIGNAMSKHGVLATLDDPETIIIAIAELISENGFLAAMVAGVILSGILASTMSTADSQLLAASSSVSENIVKEVMFKDLSEKANMVIARITLLVISVVGVIIARNPDSSVFDIVSFSWAGFGAAFGPVVLCALFWKRSNWQGALAGMVSGGVMVFVWKFLIKPMGGIWGIYELLPAFIVALVAIIVVSLATKAPSKEITDEFEKVAAMK